MVAFHFGDSVPDLHTSALNRMDTAHWNESTPQKALFLEAVNGAASLYSSVV